MGKIFDLQAFLKTFKYLSTLGHHILKLKGSIFLSPNRKIQKMKNTYNFSTRFPSSR